VAFLIKNSWRNGIHSYNWVNKRIINVKIKADRDYLTIAESYAPEAGKKENTEEFCIFPSFNLFHIPFSFSCLFYLSFNLFSVIFTVGTLPALIRAVSSLPSMSHLYPYFPIFIYLALHYFIFIYSIVSSFHFHLISLFLFFPILIPQIVFRVYSPWPGCGTSLLPLAPLLCLSSLQSSTPIPLVWPRLYLVQPAPISKPAILCKAYSLP
jgi:hypothetical protein